MRSVAQPAPGLSGGREEAPTLRAMPANPIDWSQLWFPGPRRAFSVDEMARAGTDRPSRTLIAVSLINFGLTMAIVLQMLPPAQVRQGVALMLLIALATVATAAWLWKRPWRGPLMKATLALLLGLLVIMLALRWQLPERADRFALTLLMTVCGVSGPILLWFLVVWRAQQIEARLAGQAERAKAIEMARRLAAAQLEPHFLFNTLASVQHWVQTKDDRAGPLLEALTGYLRATLPMFNKPLLPAEHELLAVQRYLQVMQARMGGRLNWRVEVEPALQATPLPPGVLLTLVENAIVHGLETRLGGGELLLRGSLHGNEARFEVLDNGAGLAAQWREGVGLSNIRERLALLGGAGARLTLAAAPGGGTRAEIGLPAVAARR